MMRRTPARRRAHGGQSSTGRHGRRTPRQSDGPRRARTHTADAVATRLRAHGIRTTTIAGGSAAESTDLLRMALDRGSMPSSSGGDGTVIAAQELGRHRDSLGIVPTGTGNDFATALGLRERDAIGAADAVIVGATRTVDLARVRRADDSSRLYATVLASGFDSRERPRQSHALATGPRRYDVAILSRVRRSDDSALRSSSKVPTARWSSSTRNC
jgi:diacylglycerol kinase (ATP)